MSHKHFIVTRFNLKCEVWFNDKSGNQVLTDDWMNQRISLFKNYCFPSVINQKCKNFEWLIYIDDETKSSYINKLNKLKKIYPFILLKTSSHESFKDQYMRDLLLMTNSKDTHLITTRLDNDDVIHNDFRGFPIFRKKSFSAFGINVSYGSSRSIYLSSVFKMSWIKFLRYKFLVLNQKLVKLRKLINLWISQ